MLLQEYGSKVQHILWVKPKKYGLILTFLVLLIIAQLFQ